MEYRDAFIWLVVILAAAALAIWAINAVAPDPFKRPLGIVAVAVAAVLLIYLFWGILAKLIPPFPGLLLPLRML